jgi:NAD-dependent dihydropyrimidine dehydrogenase PreA subunit
MPPMIDLEKCTGCGSCVEDCPNEVLALKNDKVDVINPDECMDCGVCIDNCSFDAITLS